MPRVKRGVQHVKRRRKLLAKVKGFRWRRKSSIKLAKEAVVKAGTHAYIDRRKKKRTNRGLWQIRINAFVRDHGLSYSRFIHLLKISGIELDRKILAELAVKQKPVLEKIIEQIKGK